MKCLQSILGSSTRTACTGFASSAPSSGKWASWTSLCSAASRWESFATYCKRACCVIIYLTVIVILHTYIHTYIHYRVVGNVSHQSIPHPDEDWDGFFNVLVANLNTKNNLFWDPVSQKLKPPIDIAKLCSIYRNKANGSKACSLS